MSFLRQLSSRFLAIFLLCGGVLHAQQLDVLSPDGGEFFTTGSIIPIIWTGGESNDLVNIEFSQDNGASWIPVASNISGNRYLWEVPAGLTGGQCLIRLTTGSTDLKPVHVRSYEGAHQGGMNSVAISPDGTLLASAGADGKVALWDLASGAKLWQKEVHTNSIILIRFSPDGTKLASGSIDRSAVLLDVATGNVLSTLASTNGYIWPVGFSPDGQSVATGNDDGTISIWDVATGAKTTTFTAHKEAVRYLEYTPDGTRIIASSTDRSASIVDVASQSVLQTFNHHETQGAGTRVIVNGIQLTQNGSTAITCGYDGDVKFWNAGSGALTSTHKYHGGAEVSELQLSPNGNWLASVGYDGTTKIVNPVTGDILADIAPSLQGMIRCSFSPNSQYLAISHFDGKATLWKLWDYKSAVSDGNWGIGWCDEQLSGVEGEPVNRDRADSPMNLE